ncbi:MAG: exodeoxyribonuclease VII small subunit [Oscillospiraceae bacterium]|nr:exodeoxyribonuclease VII small subunit [Oscillospiraceae bacterium]
MTAKKQSLTFEESLARLEEIVRHLEKGDLPLGDTLKLYEEGTGLIASCSRMLDEAEQKVVKLKKGPDRKPIETDFEEEGQA